MKAMEGIKIRGRRSLLASRAADAGSWHTLCFLPLFLPGLLHDEKGALANQTAPASDDHIGLIQRSCIQ